jgi:hypothetical protein
VHVLHHDPQGFPGDGPPGLRALLYDLRAEPAGAAATRAWERPARDARTFRRARPHGARDDDRELRDSLRRAIANEQFELAASIRDKIKGIE